MKNQLMYGVGICEDDTLQKLHVFASGLGPNPIIFLAHSVGGLAAHQEPRGLLKILGMVWQAAIQ
jgi:hypothetical protein